MVRISTHPLRLLALKYGADYVFSEELIDQRILRSTRVVNDELNTVDFLLPDGSVTFRTSAEERKRVVAQLGTPDAKQGLNAAKMLENDVVAIDVNMGCPKEYSIKGGMGAALLTQPDKVKDILTCLTTSLRVPVTCKIRILPKLEDTLALAKLIESTGVAALTVHGRTPGERPRHRNHDEVIRAISETVSIPVIANGGSRDTIRLYEDIEFFRQQTGAAAVMVARAAMWNPSIFLSPKHDRVPPLLHDVVREFLTLAVRYDLHATGTKYCIQQMLHLEGDTPLFLDTLAAKDAEELCSVWGVSSMYKAEMTRRSNLLKLAHMKRPAPVLLNSEMAPKRCRLNGDSNVSDEQDCDTIRMCLPFERRYWPMHGATPKQLLHEYCNQKKLEPPEFNTIEDREARLFYSTVRFERKLYENISGCKSKKYSEQAAALVCLEALGLPNGKCERKAVSTT
ncbi:hypothetical protein P879_04160 [Paragonimus westermani]|uniref:DRBM domain-containing protein n=1 Tax=Paragonimus westermani TaxID=34504 RepID=A0A8T0DU14_9TREM|nr:hypothetical protein P879_04160 [Paragonimus westermani]